MAMVKIWCIVYVTRLMQLQTETLMGWPLTLVTLVPNNICVILYVFNLSVLSIFIQFSFHLLCSTFIFCFRQTKASLECTWSPFVLLQNPPPSSSQMLIHHTKLSPHENTHGSLTGLENGNHTSSCLRDSRSVPKPSGLPCCLPPT